MSARLVDHATARRAALIATIWVPLAIVTVAEAVVVIVGAEDPHDLIVRWGGHVEWGAWWDYAIFVPAVGLPIIVGTGIVVARSTKMIGMNSWMPAIVIGVTMFHAVGMGMGVVVLNASPLTPTLPLGGGIALGIAAGLLTWWFLPKEAPSPIPVESAGALPARPGQIAGWTGRIEQPARLRVLLGTIAVFAVTAGIVLVVTVGWHGWPEFVVAAWFLLVLLATSEFVVSAGPNGLLARSIIGWPRLRVASADIATAGVVKVDPMAEFGGWGVRWVIGPRGKGRWGILTRRGPALEVVRRDGRSLVITINDPVTAASVLERYAKECP